MIEGKRNPKMPPAKSKQPPKEEVALVLVPGEVAA